MYVKLALRNVRKSAKDYLIYTVTLILCVGLFYSFLSICSNYYVSSLPVEYDLQQLQRFMFYPIIIITALLFFLILYVNNYMMRRKLKEFAIQVLMGMEQKSTALLFFMETIVMGMAAIVLGVVVGAFFSQILTLMIMNFFQVEYHMYFSLFPDTVGITVAGFCFAFIIVGFLNIHKISKYKIIDMLRAGKELQNDMKKEYLMPFMIAISIIIISRMIYRGLNVRSLYQSMVAVHDRNLSDMISIYANIIIPCIYLAVVLYYLILCIVKRKRLAFRKLVVVLTGLIIMIIIFALRIVAGHPRLDDTTTYRYFIYVCAYLVILMFEIFYSLSVILQNIKERSKKWKYKGHTLFILGQMNGRLRASSRTMSILAGTILLAFTAFIIDPILSGWAMGYLEKRAVYDLQINRNYNSKSTLETLTSVDFTFIDDVLNQKDVELSDAFRVELYFMEKKDFVEGSSNQPMMVMSLSDYNHLRTLAGYEKIQLKQGEYTAQWHHSATNQMIDDYLDHHSTITVQGETLAQAKQVRYREELGEVIYTWETCGVIIIPDALCDGLLMGNCNYYGKFSSKLSYQKSLDIYNAIHDKILKMEGNPYRTQIRMRTVQRNDGVSMALLMKLLLFYGGIVLLIISFTVLSLQQLADSYDFKHRFQIIQKLGVSKSSINKLIISQMSIWFGLPIMFAGLCAWIAGSYFIEFVKQSIEIYIGLNQLYGAIFKMLMVMLVLFICYFTSSWVLFKKNIETD